MLSARSAGVKYCWQTGKENSLATLRKSCLQQHITWQKLALILLTYIIIILRYYTIKMGACRPVLLSFPDTVQSLP